jgi:hypothetical protein
VYASMSTHIAENAEAPPAALHRADKGYRKISISPLAVDFVLLTFLPGMAV